MNHPDPADELPADGEWEATPPPPGPWDAPEPAFRDAPTELDFENWTPTTGPVDVPAEPVAPPETGPGWDARLGVFDLETTGVDVDTARIVSACVAVLEPDGAPVVRWDWLADPGIEIPEGAAAVHGITTERARTEGRPAEVVVAEVAQALRALVALGIPIVVYNAPFDLSLLDRECRRHGIEPLEGFGTIVDPLVMDKHVDRYRRGKRTLTVTSEFYGVSLDDAHDAGADALAAGRVAQTLARRYPKRLGSLDGLHERQARWYAAQAASFEDYVRTRRGEPGFVADRSWPARPLADPTAFADTQPIPVPAPRPSETVPMFDVTGVIPVPVQLELETFVAVSAEPLAAPPPAAGDEGDVPEGEASEEEPEEDPEETLADASADEDAEAEAEPLLVDDADAGAEDAADAEAAPVEAPSSGDDEAGAADASVQERADGAMLHITAAIVNDPEGRTLLVRKRGTTAFMQPGGKIERGESALTALVRELEEELGLVVDPGQTEFLGTFFADAANEADTRVRAQVFSLTTTAAPVAAAEIEELVWLESLSGIEIELAPLSREQLLPIWERRRPAAGD